MPAGVSNGISIIEPERSQVVHALASGESVNSIADRLCVDWRTVNAVKVAEFSKIEQRKPIIAAQSERTATLAADRINEKLESNADIPLNLLVPVFGVAVDKMLALRGDQVSTIRHIHSIDIQDDDLVAFAVQRSEKRAKATVITDGDANLVFDNAQRALELQRPIAPAKPRTRKRRRKVGGTKSSNPVVDNQALKSGA